MAILISDVKISNPGRVVDEVSGLSKLDVIRYYDDIAEWALPYLHSRHPNT
jgi:bifunctional non-homologous end joining protein LigD